MPNKRKQAMAIKRQKRQLPSLLRDVIIAGVSGDKYEHYLKLPNYEKIMPSLGMQQGLIKTPFQWAVQVSLLLEGGKYKHDYIRLAKPYLKSTLYDLLTDAHYALVNRYIDDGIWALAWIAAPRPIEIPNIMAHEIYTSIGAWVKQGE